MENKKDNSGRPWDALYVIIIGFIVLVLFLMLFGSTACAQEPDLQGYSIEAWEKEQAEHEKELLKKDSIRQVLVDSLSNLNDYNCDSLESIISEYQYKFELINKIINDDSLIFSDTLTTLIHDTLLFWKQYVGDVEIEQAGFYQEDSNHVVYFKVRNFDTVFHDNIYMNAYQGDSIRLRKDHAFEGLNPNESFHKRYISRFATDTTDYTFILHENEIPTDTAIVSWNSHSFNLKKVDDVKFE